MQLTEKKKLPPMLARLKKKGKLKLKREDIDKYATEDEKKQLKEDFEEEHGIPSGDDAGVEETEPPEAIEGPGEEIETDEDNESAENDLLANLIATADDGVLEALLAIIQEELESRGGDVDVSAELPGDKE